MGAIICFEDINAKELLCVEITRRFADLGSDRVKLFARKAGGPD